ncbi:hypothetical protein [Streptomyces sp. NPDC015350]|uniref:hypothetical protein n=1 Tax=Streptomyces sp. NPDC015350 TaxID=3364955 RepID=UPI0036FC3705
MNLLQLFGSWVGGRQGFSVMRRKFLAQDCVLHGRLAVASAMGSGRWGWIVPVLKTAPQTDHAGNGLSSNHHLAVELPALV